MAIVADALSKPKKAARSVRARNVVVLVGFGHNLNMNCPTSSGLREVMVAHPGVTLSH